MTDTSRTDHGLPPLLDVRALVRTLWQRKLLVLATIVALVAVAVAYVALTPPIYTANASILVDPRSSKATNFDGVLPGFGADSAQIASQVSVIGSRDLLKKVFDAQGLADAPEYTDRGLKAKIESLYSQPEPVSKAAAFQNFRDHVTVNREGLTYVIDVSVSSLVPERAAAVANAIVARYKASLESEQQTANSEVTRFLDTKIKGLQGNVADADRKVQDFKDKHDLYDPDSGGTLQSRIDQLTTRLGNARDRADQASDRYQQALDAGHSPEDLGKLADILDSPTAQTLRQQYNSASTALANARSNYGDRHPRVRRLRAQLSKVEGLASQEAERITRKLKADRDLAATNVDKLKAQLSELRAQTDTANLDRVKLRELQRNADASRSVLDDFLQRSQQTSQLKGMQLSQVRVIESAAPPVSPTWPKTGLILPVSGVLGLLAGCSLALLLGPKGDHGEMARASGPETTPSGWREGDARHALAVSTAAPALAAPAVANERTAGEAIADLGVYTLPIAATASARTGIRTLRRELAGSEQSETSLQVLRLLRRILGRLDDHAEPFVLSVAPLVEGSEHKLAAALVGLGLRQLDERVLVVEVAADDDQPGAASSISARRGTAIFTDQASGLETIVLARDAEGTEGYHDIHALLDQIGNDFDFVVIVAASTSSRDESFARIEAISDLAITAFASTTAKERAADDLGARDDDGTGPQRAVIVVERSDAGDHSGFRPRLVSSGKDDERRAGGQGHGLG
ncbi:GumC family protein [Pararhizobium mangrovi]|nr:GumC family protein [Pararhizobium mangrovi]